MQIQDMLALSGYLVESTSSIEFIGAGCGASPFMFFFQAEDGIRDLTVTGVQTCALPIFSLRGADDPASGNRFAGVTIAAPVGESDPVERMRQVREQVIAGRSEPAIDVIGRLAPVLSLLPDEALHEVIDRITPPDIQASNVPGYAQETFLARAPVDRQ